MIVNCPTSVGVISPKSWTRLVGMIGMLTCSCIGVLLLGMATAELPPVPPALNTSGPFFNASPSILTSPTPTPVAAHEELLMRVISEILLVPAGA